MSFFSYLFYYHSDKNCYLECHSANCFSVGVSLCNKISAECHFVFVKCFSADIHSASCCSIEDYSGFTCHSDECHSDKCCSVRGHSESAFHFVECISVACSVENISGST